MKLLLRILAKDLMLNRSRKVKSGPILVESSALRKQGRVRLRTKELRLENLQTPPRNACQKSQKIPAGITYDSYIPPPSDDSPDNPFLAPTLDMWVDEDDDEEVLDANHKTQHDFVREWIPKAKDHLRVIMARQSISNGGLCSYCGDTAGLWTCVDCQSLPAFCRKCCRDRHLSTPFHRIKFWSGTHYRNDWLFNIGVVVSLGHNGAPCPSTHIVINSESEPTQHASSAKINVYESPSGVRDFPCGAELFTIGHANGVHKAWVFYCSCDNSQGYDLQLLSAGLFPLSFYSCRSAFTFAMLDDFRQENLICQVSSYLYYKKLRRLTHPWFFDAVPNRYKELRRISKQWRYLKHLKHAGVPYTDKTNSPLSASLALFCAACPQEGVNIPTNWKEDPEQLPYTRSFVMDGNFSAVHQRQRGISTEPWLSDGSMFLAKREEFDRYLLVATEEKEVPTCNRYHAVNDRLVKHKGRDVTGIGSTACARHGAFCPGATVNFQRGERQVNMDYSLCSAIANTNVGELPRLLMLYDINCQYHVNFRRRIERNPGIHFPFNKTTNWGIGEFHVTAHVPHCFSRYSPHFILGAGSVDGEILETLWSLLRDVFPSTQTSTLATRAEMLDDHMQESNWKKILGIVRTISTKYTTACDNANTAIKAFDKLSVKIRSESASQLQQWENMALAADVERLANPAAMDIYDTKYEAKASRAQRQNEEHQEELRTGQNAGATAWLVEGMKLQELQHAVRVLCKRTVQTESTKAQISRKREELQSRLIKFHDAAEAFIPGHGQDFSPQGSRSDWQQDDFVDSDEDCVRIPDLKKKRKAPTLDSPRKRRRPDPSSDPTLPEHQDLLLPSTLGIGPCTSLNLLPLVAKELNLREGQANDALSAIRLAIGEKSFLLREKVRPVSSKKQKGRSWDSIHAATRRLRSNQWIYTKARGSMIALGASKGTMTEYEKLTEDDLRTITTIVVPNAPGQEGKGLSWIWTVGAGSSHRSESDEHDPDEPVREIDGSQIITELTRVNWLRARAYHRRCQEELNQTKHEMVWSIRYFLNRHRIWNDIWLGATTDLQGYAAAQSAMWYEIACYADSTFRSVYKSLPNTFGYIAPHGKNSK